MYQQNFTDGMIRDTKHMKDSSHIFHMNTVRMDKLRAQTNKKNSLSYLSKAKVEEYFRKVNKNIIKLYLDYQEIILKGSVLILRETLNPSNPPMLDLRLQIRTINNI